MSSDSENSAAAPGGPDLDGTEARLWKRLAVLSGVGVLSLVVLTFQGLASQAEIRRISVERDRAVVERDTARQGWEAIKQQLGALGEDLAAAKASRSELSGQVAATERDGKRVAGELASLKAQRTALSAQVADQTRRREEAEHKAAEAVQHRTRVEAELVAVRSELVALQAQRTPARGEAKNARNAPAKPAR